MQLAEVFEEIAPIVGFASLTQAPGSVGTKPKDIPTLKEARKRLEALSAAQCRATSDAEWWGFAGQVAYWRCLIDLLTAAEITGPDDLPEFAVPSLNGGVVMDNISRLEEFGKVVLTMAQGLKAS